MCKRMPKYVRRNYLALVTLVGVGNLVYVVYKMCTNGFDLELVDNMLAIAMSGFMIQNVDTLYSMGNDSK